jgi:hypothetical protein
MRHFGKTLLIAALVSIPSIANATAVIGGNTRLAFSSLISGLSVGLLGSANLVGGAPGLTINFGITGGDLDAALAGTIRHDGSGVSLSNGTNTLALSNFVIDTVSSTVFGDAALNGTVVGGGLSLFVFNLGSVTVGQLTDLSNPALDLSLTSTASGALDAAFGTGDTIGLSIGLAATAPVLAAIPEPENWALLIIGFGMIGVTARARQKRVRALISA